MDSLTHSLSDLEPDDEWKTTARKQIEDALRSMLDDTKRTFNLELQQAVLDEDKRNSLTNQHLETIKSIRAMAPTQFEEALKKERQLRRWSHGLALESDDEFHEALVKEQQSILDNIKKEETHSDRPPRLNRPTRDHSDEPPPPPPLPDFERSAQRPIQRPPPSSPSTAHFPDSPSSRRPSASSPPKMVHEFWKPTISPEEDAAASTPYAIARRGSTASTGSTTSATFRSSISNPVIQQRPDSDLLPPADNSDRERSTRPQPVFDHDRNQPPKSREWEKRPSQSSRVDPRQSIPSEFQSYHHPKDDFGPPSSRPVDSRVYQSSLSATKPPISTKRSFTADDPSRTYHTPSSPTRPIVNQRSFTADEPNRPHPHSITNKRSFIVDDPLNRTNSNNNYHHLPPRSVTTKRSFTVDDGRYYHHPPPSPQQLPPPSPSANRPIVNKRSFPAHEESAPGRYPPPSPTKSSRWPGPSRSPNDGRFDYSFPRSPHSPDDNSGWKWAPTASSSSSSSIAVKLPLAPQGYDPLGDYGRPDVVEEEVEYDSDSEDDEDDEDEPEYPRVEDIEAQTRRREEEAKRKEDEARMKEEGARKTVEEAQRKEEEAKRKEEEAKRKEEDARRKEEEARRKEEEAEKKEEEARRKEQEAKRIEEAARLKEEQVRLREEEVKRREEELNRREAEAKRMEEERKRREEGERKRREEEERRRKEEERRRREEEERKRREEERKREGERQRREEEERKKKEKEEEFRQRAEEIQRRSEERKQQQEMGGGIRSGSTPTSGTFSSSNGPWSGGTSPPTSSDRSSTHSSNRSSASSTWSSASTQASSTSRSSTTPTPSNNNPASSTGSGSGSGSGASGKGDNSTGTFGGGRSSSPSSTSSTTEREREWARRQAELAKEQQEKFRREQERLERERQAKAATAGRIPTKEEVVRLFATHERQWAMLPNLEELRWDHFPWPMLRRASGPEELTEGAIGAYVMSLFHPGGGSGSGSGGGEKAKSVKERIKDHIRKWHPDRFDTRLLPKVVEEERGMVKEGAGAVVRSLTNLLMNNSGSRGDVFS